MPKRATKAKQAGLTHDEYQRAINELGLAQACIRRAYERLRHGLGESEWLRALDNAHNDVANAMDYAVGKNADATLNRLAVSPPAA